MPRLASTPYRNLNVPELETAEVPAYDEQEDVGQVSELLSFFLSPSIFFSVSHEPLITNSLAHSRRLRWLPTFLTLAIAFNPWRS